MKGAIAVNIAGSVIILLLGAVIALASLNPDFTAGVARGLGQASSDVDPHALVVIAGVLIAAYGLYLTGLNVLLGWFMVKRASWAWITAIVLLAIGMLLQLVQAISNPVSVIWLALFQAPAMFLLVLAPTRQWCGIGSRGAAQMQEAPYQPYPGPGPFGQPQPYTPAAPPVGSGSPPGANPPPVA